MKLKRIVIFIVIFFILEKIITNIEGIELKK